MKNKLKLTIEIDYDEFIGDLNKERYLSKVEEQKIRKLVNELFNKSEAIKKIEWEIEELKKFESSGYEKSSKMGACCSYGYVKDNYNYKYPYKKEIKRSEKGENKK